MPPKPTTQERLTKHDREIAAIRTLVLTGMKMIVSLTASQRKTDQQLQDFIRSLRGGNGHAKRNVNLQ
ncbi:MAG TPA: hypothetical protein VKJ01_16140 [Candidatus Solibacter sp.]|nr:hypothetical protein [Candidatus Solibacter sp.]